MLCHNELFPLVGYEFNNLLSKTSQLLCQGKYFKQLPGILLARQVFRRILIVDLIIFLRRD